jgi:formylglycine-generating enzyme required for sulfatase activity
LLTNDISGQTISKKYSLPGFVQVNDTLFISTSEVSIRDYAFFLTSIRNYDSVQFANVVPDVKPINWRVKSYNNTSFATYDKIYEIGDSSLSWQTWIWFYPIVNISKSQALVYCKYLTDNYTSVSVHFNKRQKRKLPPNLVYRLPTEAEWISIASSFLDPSLYPLGKSSKTERNAIPICREYFNDTTDFERHPLGSQSGWNYGLKNDLDVFNMAGNVSEIVADTDNVLGGSFIDPLIDCHVTSKKKFLNPEDFIGFRVVAVIR